MTEEWQWGWLCAFCGKTFEVNNVARDERNRVRQHLAEAVLEAVGEFHANLRLGSKEECLFVLGDRFIAIVQSNGSSRIRGKKE
jgi:hypothetical protein